MKILQIIPADGWYAGFRDSDKIKYFHKIVCWAIIQHTEDTWGMYSVKPGDTIVTGMTNTEGYFDEPESHSNFAGYFQLVDEGVFQEGHYDGVVKEVKRLE